MKQQTSTHFGVNTSAPELSLAWDKNPSVQKLLDVVIHILANEYIWAVRENPTLFKEIASAASRPRNDGGELI